LYTFITLREDYDNPAVTASSKNNTAFSWRVNCVEQSKSQQKLIKHFIEQTKAKPFRYLTRHIEEITELLSSSTQTLFETDKFFTKVVVILFPGLPWPTHWYHPDDMFG